MHKCSRPECTVQTKNLKYCSRSCAQKVNNSKQPKRKTIHHSVECLYERCNKLVISQGKYKKVFCSMYCANNQKFMDTKNEWFAGNHDGMTKSGNKVCAWVRAELIYLYGEKCSICGWNEVHPITKRIPVELDHIDGDWTNSSFNNVRLLCPNCHALTPTYRFLNSAVMRESRGEPLIGQPRKRVKNSPRKMYKISEEIDLTHE